MTSKECIDIIDELISKNELDEEFFKAWNEIKKKYEKSPITENGIKILQYMKDNKDVYNNIFTAKSIGEGLSIGSKVVSGAMRKLVTDGYVGKLGGAPVSYAITDSGINMI